jgi:histidinol-phosphate aminotransferase
MAICSLAPSSTPTRPAHFDIERVIRPNILALHPYRCARDDYSSGILLDANENALGHSISHSDDTSPSTTSSAAATAAANTTVPPVARAELDPILGLDLHRYPDPSHPNIKSRIAELRGLPSPDHVFLGVGSDEVIDLLMRVCVVPGGHEKILITPPTYGMYAVCAQVNDLGVVRVNLELSADHGEGGERGRFSLRVDEVRASRPTVFSVLSSINKRSFPPSIFTGKKGDRCRSVVNQAHILVLARKPHWDTHLSCIHSGDT